MVDPRIYRAGLALVVLAVIVCAFSLSDQPGPARTTLAPAVVTGTSTAGATAGLATLQQLDKSFPVREPGSTADRELAGAVAQQFRTDRSFAVTQRSFTAATALGQRTLTAVTASRVGLTGGAIVVVADRDPPGTAGLSGTVALLGLAHEFAGETLSHPLMLVSTTGSVGAAGATELARMLAGQPVDAVIVLGDLASAQATRPAVIPWSDSPVLAPPMLASTLGGYASSLAGIAPGSPGFPAQFAHLAFPLTGGAQGPFGRHGLPAVLLSLSGNRAPAAAAPVSAAHLAGLQAAVLQTVSALDTAPRVPAPSGYLLLGGKVVPLWAVRLLVLALIVPVLLAIVDALARVRRRGSSVSRWLAWVLAGAVPFLVVLVALLIVRVAGVLPATPPGPVAGDGAAGVGLGAAGIAVLCVCGLLLVASFWFLRPLCLRAAARIGSSRGPAAPAGDAAAVALMLVLLILALVAWVFNPFTAALLVLPLHLWLWLAVPAVRARRPLAVAGVLIGIAPVALVVAYYAHSLGLSPLGLVWTGVLLVAGGQITSPTGIFWALLAGCFTGALILALRAWAPAREKAPAEVTVRGPVSYAGPGSLGGTESALGSRR